MRPSLGIFIEHVVYPGDEFLVRRAGRQDVLLMFLLSLNTQAGAFMAGLQHGAELMGVADKAVKKSDETRSSCLKEACLNKPATTSAVCKPS